MQGVQLKVRSLYLLLPIILLLLLLLLLLLVVAVVDAAVLFEPQPQLRDVNFLAGYPHSKDKNVLHE
jgi:hypothetical protein